MPQRDDGGRGSVLVFRSSRRKFIYSALISLAFAVVGVLMIVYGNALGWPAALFFGLLLAMAVFLSVFPGSLTLTGEGFAYRPPLGKGTTWRWSDVGSFGSVRDGVTYSFSPSYRSAHRIRAETPDDDERLLPGFDNAEETARTMEEWRRRAESVESR